MAKNLIKNTAVYFLTNLISQVAVFVLWIFIARFLPASEVGIYALTIFIIDFFGEISIFGLSAALTRFYYSDEEVNSVLSNAFIIFIFSNALSVTLLFILAKPISYLLPGLFATLSQNMFLFSEIIIASSLYNFALSHYTALKHTKSFSKISLLQTILFSLFSLAFLGFGFRIYGVFYALLISYLFSGLLFLIKESKNISFKFFSINVLKSIAHYGIPMMIYSVFGVFVVYVGRIFLDKYTDLSTLGVYSFFLAIAMQVNGVWSTFNRAWTPEIFSELKENRERALLKVKTMTFISSFIYLCFLGALIIFAKTGALGLILKQEYLSDINMFYILLLGPLFTGIYTACYPLYYYEKKTKIVMFISIFLNLANVFFTLFMVKFFGQTGATLSYFIISVVTVFAFILSFKKSMKIPFEIINWSLLLSLMVFIAVFLFLKTSSDIIFLFFIVVSAFLAYKVGDLDKKKHLLSEFIKSFRKIKTIDQTI